MLCQDGLDDGLLRDRLVRLGRVFTLRLEVVNVEAQDVPVLDGVGDGVDVELLLEQVRRGAHGGSSSSIFWRVALDSKMGVPVKPKSWDLGKNSLIAL